MKKVLLVGIAADCHGARFAIEKGLQSRFPNHEIHTVLGMTYAAEVVVNEDGSTYDDEH